jgi:hypothetical protein
VAILIDPAVWLWRDRRWAHLVSDSSYEELHAFAFRLGLERRWFQGDHYDVPGDYREVAIALGAQPIDSRQLVRRLRASGLRLTGAERRQLPRHVVAGPVVEFSMEVGVDEESRSGEESVEHR